MLSNKRKASHKFTPDEDNKILDLIAQYGNDWPKIAKNLPNRNAKQCRERYINYLNPSVNKNPWTEYEDQLLLEKFNEYGSKWTKIMNFFPGRSDIDIKNHYNKLIYRQTRRQKLQITSNDLLQELESLSNPPPQEQLNPPSQKQTIPQLPRIIHHIIQPQNVSSSNNKNIQSSTINSIVNNDSDSGADLPCDFF